MELRQLENFVAVAEERSFTKAAQRLNYVQSALSVSIRSLERELDVRLFDRTTHRVLLTDAGNALLEPARRTLASAEETRDAAAAVKGVLRGTLRIGIMQSFTFLDVPHVLGDFHRAHPNVEIQVRPAAGGSAALLDDLRSSSLDVAFVSLLETSLPGLTVTPLAFEKLMFVSTEDTSRPSQRAIALASLTDANFVDFPVGWGVRAVVDRAFADAGLERRVTIEVADVATLLQLIRAGLGVALLPASLLPPGDALLRTRSVTPSLGWHVAMVVPAKRTTSAATRAFMQLIR